MLTILKSATKPTMALALLAGALLYSPAYAEERPIPAMAPDAPVPALTYQSAFEGYQRWDDAPMKGWREAHQEVMESGNSGHAGHGAVTPSQPAPATPTKQPAAGAMPHGGHH